MPAKPPISLTTRRLVLRRAEPDDAEAIFAEYAQDAEVTRYLAWRPHDSAEETRAFLGGRVAAWQAGESFAYVVTRPDDGRPFGMIEMQPGEHGMVFGYALARRCWGQRIAAEALAALVDWALAQPTAWRVWAVCDTENRASARVMEKAGLRFEGVLRRWSVFPNLSPEPRDCLVYAKTR